MPISFDRKFLLNLVFDFMSREAGLGWDLGLGFPTALMFLELGWAGWRLRVGFWGLGFRAVADWKTGWHGVRGVAGLEP